MSDFSLYMYRKLLDTLKESGYFLISVRDYLSHDLEYRNQPVAIIRHDIDRRLHKAEVFAAIESDLGIKTSYYFRYKALSHPGVIRSVARKGHEIGYHYEVMSRADGDPDLAMNLFEDDLHALRSISRIETVCMHGAPLSKINNLTFWDHHLLEDFDLVGEAFLSVSGVEYFSDTGRTWSPDHKMRDRLKGSILKGEHGAIRSTSDLIQYIRSFRPFRIYILTHPERWSENLVEWVLLYGIDNAVNLGKTIISRIRG